MPVIPPGRLTRAQIVGLAIRRAGNTVLNQGTGTVLAGTASGYEAQTWLNQVLYDLYTVFTWPFLRTSTTFNLAGSTFSLPTDFLTTPDDDALAIIQQEGVSTYSALAQLDPGAFYRTLGPGQATGTPAWWMVDPATTTGQVYPVPVSTVTLRLLYQSLPTEIPVDSTGDATIPTFPWSDYLIQALFARILQYEMDPRAVQEMVLAETMLQKMMQRANYLRSQAPVLELDRQVFGNYGPDGRGGGGGYW